MPCAAVCAVNKGIKQHGAGIGEIAQGGGDVGGDLHAHGFEIGAAELLAEGGCFVAVELQNVNRHAGEDFADALGGFVHKQGDHADKRGQHAHDGLRLGDGYAAFAAGEKNQPDGICAQLRGDLGILGAGDAADFGLDFGHGWVGLGGLKWWNK